MLLLVSSLVLCACANGLAVGENKAAPSPLVVYKAYSGVGRFAIVDVPMTWVEASQVCRSVYGHLAFPETAAELAVLKNIIDQNGKIYYIGFHDQFKEGKYVTVKYQQLRNLDYNLTWAPGQPNGSLTQNCGGLAADGIYDLGCDGKSQFICEDDDPLSDGGSLGYERIGTYGLYKMMKGGVYWPDAVESCQGEGSHLWIVNSADEQAAVYDRYESHNSLWTGVHHVYANHFFVTIFDEKLEKTGYTKWAPGQPNGNNTQYPYVLMTKEGLRVWSALSYYICEYNQPF